MNRRYLKNFPLFGKSGQHALLDSKVLVIGAGGLGCSALYNLAAAGVGKIGIADFDRVSVSNLNRQILFDNKSINRFKVDTAKERLSEFNPDCSISTYKIDIKNNPEIINGYEIIADCSDNFSTRFLINEYCHRFKKTLVSAAVIGYGGHIMIFKSHLGGNYPCYQCFCLEEPEQTPDNSCEGSGILGAAAVTIGGIQSAKIIQEILQENLEESGFFLRYDLLKNIFQVSRIKKDSECKICSYS